jgi:hypothetical protein
MDDGAAPTPEHAGGGRRTVPVQKVINRSGQRVPWPRSADRAAGRHRASPDNASHVTPAHGDPQARGEARHSADDGHRRPQERRHHQDHRARHACEPQRHAHSHAEEHDVAGAARTQRDDHRRDRHRIHGRHYADDATATHVSRDGDAAQDHAAPKGDGTGHEGTGHEGTGHEGTGHEGTGHEGTGHEGTGHESAAPEPTSQASGPEPAMAAVVALT